MSISCSDVCSDLVVKLVAAGYGLEADGCHDFHELELDALAKAIVLSEPVRLVVVVRGGVVQHILADEKEHVVQVVLHDLDSMKEGDEPGLFPTDWQPTMVASAFQEVEEAGD